METRKIGSLEVSVIGLGCNNFGRRLDAEATEKVVSATLDSGINFFDTADVYGNGQSETFIGLALGKRRNEAVIATKFGNNMPAAGHGGSPAYLRQAVEASLKRLSTDHIDLYQLHNPDPEVPIADTLGVLNELVQAGKVREIGCSNFSAVQLREADHTVRAGAARFVSVQNEYSLLHRDPESEVLPTCQRLGLVFLPYFPLASGLLTGKYRQGTAAPEKTRIVAPGSTFAHWLSSNNLALVESLIGFAEARGHSMLELAFAWLLAQPTVASVIAGAMTVEQVQSNAAAGAAQWHFTAADLAEINTVLAH